MESAHSHPALRSPAGSGVSWRRRWGEFCFFLALFAAYDLVVWASQAAAPQGVSLINYIVRDGRTDESAMYWPFVRDAAAGEGGIADPYLVEYRTSPDIKPRIPTWLCALVFRITGNANLAIVVIHSLFPAAAALLLVEISALFLSRSWAFVLSILSAAGLAYAFNDLADLLQLADLQGPHKYNAIEHLFRGSGLHMEFQRYFSPGLTLAPFLLGVWILCLDPQFLKRRTPILTGLLLGLHSEIYIHGGVTLLTFSLALLALAAIREFRSGSFRASLWRLIENTSLLLGMALITAIPWLLRLREFRQLQYAKEIMFRVGNFDFSPDVFRLPLIAWMLLAVLLRCAAKSCETPSHFTSPSAAKRESADQIWVAMILTMVVAGWLAGIAGEAGFFPCSHLICLRYLSYLAPLWMAYSIRLLLQLARPRLAEPAGRTLQALGWAVAGMLLAMVVYGEYRAARNCSPLYVITPEMAKLRDEVLPATAPKSVILTEDLRLASFLVCETDRNSYIGYASVSLAPTGELIDRLMVPSILAGRSFEEFERDHYQSGRGLPQGPSGQHWVLHHGGDIAPVPRPDLVDRYQGLQQLPPDVLLRRYRLDYYYTPATPPAPPYAPYFQQATAPGLYQLRLAP